MLFKDQASLEAVAKTAALATATLRGLRSRRFQNSFLARAETRRSQPWIDNHQGKPSP
jgi:hypothetical protein